MSRQAMCRAHASGQVDDAASRYGKAQLRHWLAALGPPPLRSTSAPICLALSPSKMAAETAAHRSQHAQIPSTPAARSPPGHLVRATPRVGAPPPRDERALRSPRPEGSLCRCHTSHPAFQHLVIPLVACPNRFENPSDAHRIGVPQAGLLRLFLFAPRFTDDPLQLRQLLCGKLRNIFFDLSKRAHKGQIAPSPPE